MHCNRLFGVELLQLCYRLSLVRPCFLDVREIVKAIVAIDAAVGPQAECGKNVLLDKTLPTGTINIGTAALRAGMLGGSFRFPLHNGASKVAISARQQPPAQGRPRAPQAPFEGGCASLE